MKLCFECDRDYFNGFWFFVAEDINNECAKCDAVRAVWNDFRKSLIRYKDAEIEKIYTAFDAAEYLPVWAFWVRL